MIDLGLWSAKPRKSIFPTHKFNLIAKEIGPNLVDFIYDRFRGLPLVIQVSGRREKYLYNFAASGHRNLVTMSWKLG